MPRRAGPGARRLDRRHTRAFEAIGGASNLLIRTTLRSQSSRPASTSRRSTALTPRSRPITTWRSCRHDAPAARQSQGRGEGTDVERGCPARCAIAAFAIWTSPTPRSARSLLQLNEQRPIRRLGSALPAAHCSRNSIGRRASPMPLPKGGSPTGPAHGLKAHAPASITSLRSRLTFVAERLRSVRTMRIAVDIATSAQIYRHRTSQATMAANSATTTRPSPRRCEKCGGGTASKYRLSSRKPRSAPAAVHRRLRG